MEKSSMPRLFVAIELPESTQQTLTRIQPPPVPGLRLAKPHQMHLTLHFIGDAAVHEIEPVLATVQHKSFQIEIQGVGRFPASGRASVLWAGINSNSSLNELHTAVGEALRATGFEPETRPYCPHITLARCGPMITEQIVDRFLVDNCQFQETLIPVDHFNLYSSTNVDGAYSYRIEQVFPLLPN